MESILKPIAEWTVAQISALGYPGIVALMAIESACIPLPSEIIMPFSGYLVFRGVFNLHLAALSGALGCAVGSTAAYYVGAFGGRPFVEKYGRYLLIRSRDMDRADTWFDRYGEAIVFVSRLLPVIRTFISFPAGVSRMNFPRFLVYSFTGSVPWCYFLAYIGMVLGQNWRSIRTYFHGADVVIGAALAAAFAIWLYHHLRPEKEPDAA